MPVQKSPDLPPSSEPADQSIKHKSNQAKSRRRLWLGLGLTSVALVSGTAAAWLANSFASKPLMQSQLTQKQAGVFDGASLSGTGLSFAQLTHPVNILVLATTSLPEDIDFGKHRPSQSETLKYAHSFDGLSDTILLLRFDPQTKKMVVLSIPRDTRTAIAGHGVRKINAANDVGGAALSALTVSQLLGGVPIDRYVRVNDEGFAKLVDTLGGLDFYVPRDMKYKDNTQHLYINLKAGQQHLNGDQALQMLKFRYDALGDIGRIQRQQQVLRALIEQFLTPVTLAKFPQIFAVIHEYIDTNLTVSEIVSVLSLAAQTNRANMSMLMVPGRFSQPKEYNTSYWIANPKGITSLLAPHFDLAAATSPALATDPAVLNIAIQDSTNHPRAVRALMRRLEAAGYRHIQIAKPWAQPLSMTHIVAQQGDGDSAAAIRRSIGFGEVRVESTGLLGSDVTIHLGQDWLHRQATAKQLSTH